MSHEPETLVAVDQHELELHFAHCQLPAKRLAELTIKDISQNMSPKWDCWPHDWTGGFERYQKELVWTVGSARSCSSDLIDSVCALFDGRAEDRTRCFIPAQPERIRSLLNGKGIWQKDVKAEQRTRKILSLDLGDSSRSARRRLAAQDTCADVQWVDVHCGTPTVVAFRSGTAILTLPLSFSVERNGQQIPPSIELLIECAYALAERRQFVWRGDDQPASFGLMEIAKLLIGSTTDFNRIALSSCVILSTGADRTDVRRVALLLARRVNSHYLVRTAHEQSATLLEPFDNIIHAVAPEGMSLVVQKTGDKESEFLDNYIRTAFRPAYAPLTVLAVHEEASLLNLLEEARFWPDQDVRATGDIAKLRNLQSSALANRSAFRYPRVSAVRMHEHFHDALEKEMQIPRLREALSTEIAEVEGLLRISYNEHIQKRFGWLGRFGASAVAGLSVYELGSALSAANFNEEVWVFNALPGIKWPPDTVVGMGLGLICGILTYLILRHRSDE